MLGFISETYEGLVGMNKRQFAHQAINLALIVTSALMIWKGLMVVTNSESPIVAVLSGSMEPGFRRGDILFLWDGADPFRVGEIVVFKIRGRDIPIVHRIIRVHEKVDGKVEMLTKGDNNMIDDIGLCARGQQWLQREHIIGRAKGFIPYLGMVTIIMNDYPYVKYVVIGLLGLLVLTSKE
eukprot:EC123580.1.p1 GENE.EC123580.1~~EC123580.1.p1  ORF type:complete len:181 (+),score=22.14 EC123580.1:87-629(+)